MEERRLTLVEHLNELRSRIVKTLFFVIFLSIICYNFVDNVLAHLVKPVGRLVFIEPQEAFISNLKLAFFGGLFLSSPFILYQIWQFVSTGLNPNEKKYILIFGPFSFILFLFGIGFGYFLIVPVGMKFLLAFSNEYIVPMITISTYISFVGMLTLAFGLIFQLPLVILFFTKLGFVTPAFLAKKRRHAIVLIFIVAAILTPPDVVTQFLMAVPLLVLYEIGILFSKLGYREYGG